MYTMLHIFHDFFVYSCQANELRQQLQYDAEFSVV